MFLGILIGHSFTFYLAKLIITTETTFSFTLMVEISTKSISESKKNKESQKMSLD